MAEQFEPMSVGQILDKTFKLYRAHFVRFVTIVALIQVPMWLIALLTGYQEAMRQGEGGPGAIILILLSVLASLLSTAAMIRSVSGAYLGEDVSVGQAYATALPKLFTILIAYILTVLAVMAGFILLIVPGIIFMLWLVLTTQCIVVENTAAIQGMKRSKALTSGNLGKVFVLLFLLGVINWIMVLLFGLVGNLVAGSASGTAAILGRGIFALIAQLLMAPISAVAMILLYYDLRIRKEGFDLAMLAQQLGKRP